MTTVSLPARAVTGKHVLLCLLGAFGVITAVNLALIVFALTSYTGETGPKSYAAGLDFNDTLAAVSAQRERGWRVDTALTPTGDRGMTVKARYTARDGSSLPGLDVVAEFQRPTSEGFDFTVGLRDDGDGHYAVDTVLPLSGQWRVRLRALASGQPPFILDYTTVVK